MKKLLIILISLLPMFAISQDYKLFNANSKKAYINIPQEDSTWCIAFDSAKTVGLDSVFYNYLGLNGTIMGDPSCLFWGYPICIEQSKPSWIGFKSLTDNNKRYSFITNKNDTLKFDFNLSIGDTSVFYQDSTQIFKIIYKNIIDTTILSISDSVQIFMVLHTDNSGNILNSSLQGMKIIIGKSMGLVCFFRIDKFPQVLQAVELIGNTSPEAGLTKINSVTVHDHHVGDEIQFYDYYASSGPNHENRYIKYYFLNRTDSLDKVVYNVKREIIDLISLTQNIDTIELLYMTSWKICEIPFDGVNGMYILNDISLTKSDYCGFKLWTIKRIPMERVYCLISNCWGNYDTQGPPLMGHSIQVCGLGIYDMNLSVFSGPSPPYGSTSKRNIVYFKKDGITCGNEVHVGMEDESQYTNYEFKVYPNPAHNNVNIEFNSTENQNLEISLIDMLGQILWKDELSNFEVKYSQQINLNKFAKGVYYIKISSKSGATVRKLIYY